MRLIMNVGRMSQAIFAAVITILVVGGIASATTIGTNITTDGNLTVSGNVGIGTTSPEAMLDVRGVLSTESQGIDYGQLVDIDWTPDDGAFFPIAYGQQSRVQVPATHTGTLNLAGIVYGVSGKALNQSSTMDEITLIGGDFQARNQSGSSPRELSGISIQVQQSGGGVAGKVKGADLGAWVIETDALSTGATDIYGANISSHITGRDAGANVTATNVYGAKIGSGVLTDSGASVSADNMYHLYLSDHNPHGYDWGTVLNKYGLYMEDLHSASSTWGFYQAGDEDNYFGGNVGIGTTSPAANFQILDTVSDGQNIFQVGTSGDSTLFQIDESGNVSLDGNLTVGGDGLNMIQGRTFMFNNSAATDHVGRFSPYILNIVNNNITDNNFASLVFSTSVEGPGGASISGNPSAGIGAQFLDHVSATEYDMPADLYFWTGYGPNGEDFGTPPSEKMRITAAGNVGIGTSTPAATLDVNGYMRLQKNNSAPASCSSANDGAISLTSTYRTCVCNGGSSTWVYTSDGSTPCVWQ